MSQALSAAQKRHLRALAHNLKPVILMGAKGLSEGLISELKLALEHHELVKIKLTGEDREARDLVLNQLIAATDAALVQRLGSMATLFLRNRERPLIVLPRS